MWSLAQYSYQTTTTSSGPSAILLLFYLVFIIAVIVGLWKVFEKAGQQGWKALIPIYNIVIMCRIVGLDPWWTLAFIFIPFAVIYLYYKICVSFGYGAGMTILVLLGGIGLLIMGFGDSKYLGPDGKGKTHVGTAA